MIHPDEPYCSIYDEVAGTTRNMKLKGSEPVIVDYVSVDVKNKKHPQKVNWDLLSSCLNCKSRKIVIVGYGGLNLKCHLIPFEYCY